VNFQRLVNSKPLSPLPLFLQIILLSALAQLVTACATVVSKPVKPTIELVSVKPLNISLSEQKIRFELKVINPNGFALPIENVNFVARFNNANIANGKSNQSVTVGANSDAQLSLDVTASLGRLAGILDTLLQGESLNLDYELSGTVEVGSWPEPIPFDVTGAMDLSDS